MYMYIMHARMHELIARDCYNIAHAPTRPAEDHPRPLIVPMAHPPAVDRRIDLTMSRWHASALATCTVITQ